MSSALLSGEVPLGDTMVCTGLPADFLRFSGQRVDLALKLAFKGRKHFQGVLVYGEYQSEAQAQEVFDDLLLEPTNLQA